MFTQLNSTDVLYFLGKKTIKWGKSATQYTQEALAKISAHIGIYLFLFKISRHEDGSIKTLKVTQKSSHISWSMS